MTVTTLKVLIPFLVIFKIIPLLIWLERKGSAYIQDRPGPNRAAIQGIRAGGLLHALADVLKLLFKEDITPNHVHKFYYTLAPFLTLTIACVTFVVIPFAAPITVGGQVFSFQAADINAGILYILAMSSLGVYGVMLAGWSSNNKYALLGGLRSSAQMVSYELSMGLAILSIILTTGSLSLNDIVDSQTASVWRWNFFFDPIACVVFIISAFAETNRAPFDLPEGESELVAGYHVEYSSMKFAMFFMAEYAHMIIASALIATLFFGGWQVPFLTTEALRQGADIFAYRSLLGFGIVSIIAGILLILKFKKGKYGDKRDYEVLFFGLPAAAIGILVTFGLLIVGKFSMDFSTKLWVGAGLQAGFFLLKILFFCWIFIWVRWTVPRFRYDQLMDLGWKLLLPVAMANLVLTSLRMYF